MMYPDDVRILTLETSEYRIPIADALILESILQRRNPPVDYSVKPLSPPQDPLAADRKAEIENVGRDPETGRHEFRCPPDGCAMKARSNGALQF